MSPSLRLTRVCISLLGWGCVLSCTDSKPAPKSIDAALAQRVLATYAEIASASYGDALREARALQVAVTQLLAAPSADSLHAAQQAWLRARTPYAQSEVFRFYDGPVDRVEVLLNTWPIDENYVEGGKGSAEKGVIDDPTRYPQLESTLLVSLNGRDGETSISTGYHVLEFLLWGRDERADAPGQRAAEDFEERADDPLRARRRRYLQLATELLVEHLTQVEAEWRRDRPRNYRSDFLAHAPTEALALALRGMGSLSGPELAGERLTVPYETKDQENEHSCFSDSTRDDVVNDVLGVQNVCLGHYTVPGRQELRGPGLCALLAALDPELGRTLSQQIETSLSAARAIPTPFDQALLGSDDSQGRRAIKGTIVALEAQTSTIARAAALLARHPGSRP